MNLSQILFFCCIISLFGCSKESTCSCLRETYQNGVITHQENEIIHENQNGWGSGKSFKEGCITQNTCCGANASGAWIIGNDTIPYIQKVVFTCKLN